MDKWGQRVIDLRLGDCLEVMRQLPTESVDSLITDPPYGIDYQSARRIDRSEWKPKIANDKQPFIWWLLDAYRITREGGGLLCFCRWDVAEAFRLAITWAGYSVRSQVMWDRQSHGMGSLDDTFAPQHDILWFATKGRFNFPGFRPSSVVRSMRLPGDELIHPNQKPIDLMRYLVRAITPDGGTVLDPFMGSGTTGAAALQEGCSFVGVEISEEYYRIAEQRIALAENRQLTLEGIA